MNFSESTGPISIKFHTQPSDRGGKKVYIFGPGHMTKMAAMPIYNKNLKKNLFSGTTRLIALKLSIWDSIYKVYVNDDPGLALTYFMARSVLVL